MSRQGFELVSVPSQYDIGTASIDRPETLVLRTLCLQILITSLIEVTINCPSAQFRIKGGIPEIFKNCV